MLILFPPFLKRISWKYYFYCMKGHEFWGCADVLGGPLLGNVAFMMIWWWQFNNADMNKIFWKEFFWWRWRSMVGVPHQKHYSKIVWWKNEDPNKTEASAISNELNLGYPWNKLLPMHKGIRICKIKGEEKKKKKATLHDPKELCYQFVNLWKINLFQPEGALVTEPHLAKSP